MTNNNTMNCDGFGDSLLSYLEHEADDATRAALERHAVACADCGALLADLRKLRSDAANLPELTPSRDLWAGIAARIEAPVVPIGTSHEQLRRAPLWTRRPAKAALLAASLLAAMGVGYLAAGGGRANDVTMPVATRTLDSAQDVAAVPSTDASQPSPAADVRSETGGRAPQRSVAAPAATTPAATTPVAPRPYAVQLAVANLNADYDREIGRLRALIEQRRNQLDPVTVAVIEKNLQVIDTAIAESKAAIARDPSSRFLIESLNQSLQTKVELMRTVAMLPSRT